MSALVAGVVVANPEIRQQVLACLRDLLVRVPIEETWFGSVDTLIERVDLVRPDVLILEIAGLGESAEETLRALRARPAAPELIVVNSTPQPSLMITAIRAGAVEYLDSPIGNRLRLTLQKIWVTRTPESSSGRAGRVLAFVSAKGGCGATTIACHLAREFERQTGQRVLLADLDLDAGMVQFLLKTGSPYSLLDAVANAHRLDPCFWNELVSHVSPRLDVLHSPATGSGPLEEAALRRVLRFARSLYDWVLLDLGRGLNPALLSGLAEIRESYLVATPDVPALYKAKRVMHTLVERGCKREHLRLIINCMPKRSDLSLDELERTVGFPVYGVVPGDDGAIEEACAAGRLVEPGGILGMHYARLAAKMAGIEVMALKPKRRLLASLFA